VEPLLNCPGLLPFAILGQTHNREALLEEIAGAISAIANVQLRNNLAASTAILSGLVLEGGFIRRVLRSDLMKESVIYQEILAEGEQRGLRQGLEQGKVDEGRSLILKQLHRRIGSIPSELQAQLTNCR
jgi:predicted transposase YdaD